jgi:hypothetical protein
VRGGFSEAAILADKAKLVNIGGGHHILA